MVDEKLHRRGDPTDVGEAVARKNIDLLGGQKVTEGSGRLQLAEWIGHPDNPLTARVIVNRVWINHFGRGLVTAQRLRHAGPDAHASGAARLAGAALRQNGWSIKQLHRIIMNTAAYQLEAGVGPEQKLYGSFQPRRLSAEELRDTLLSLGQTLDYSTPAGHPFPATPQLHAAQPFPGELRSQPPQCFPDDPAHPAAAVDGAVRRGRRQRSTGQRRLSNVPTQALYFLNNDFLHRQAAALAKRLAKRTANPAGRIRQAHQLALGRPATEEEVAQVEIHHRLHCRCG